MWGEEKGLSLSIWFWFGRCLGHSVVQSRVETVTNDPKLALSLSLHHVLGECQLMFLGDEKGEVSSRVCACHLSLCST